jgi:hypothetical protein
MEPDLIALLAEANKMQREGLSRPEIDALLMKEYGFTKRQLAEAVRALPPVRAPRPLGTADLLYSGLRGATFGLAPETKRQKELKEAGFEDEMRGMKLVGGTAGALVPFAGAARIAGVGKAPAAAAGAALTQSAGRLLVKAAKSKAAKIAGGSTVAGAGWETGKAIWKYLTNRNR